MAEPWTRLRMDHWVGALGEIERTEAGFVWTDRDGRKSAPLPSLMAARLFAARHRVLKRG